MPPSSKGDRTIGGGGTTRKSLKLEQWFPTGFPRNAKVPRRSLGVPRKYVFKINELFFFLPTVQFYFVFGSSRLDSKYYVPGIFVFIIIMFLRFTKKKMKHWTRNMILGMRILPFNTLITPILAFRFDNSRGDGTKTP